MFESCGVQDGATGIPARDALLRHVDASRGGIEALARAEALNFMALLIYSKPTVGLLCWCLYIFFNHFFNLYFDFFFYLLNILIDIERHVLSPPERSDGRIQN